MTIDIYTYSMQTQVSKFLVLHYLQMIRCFVLEIFQFCPTNLIGSARNKRNKRRLNPNNKNKTKKKKKERKKKLDKLRDIWEHLRRFISTICPELSVESNQQ